MNKKLHALVLAVLVVSVVAPAFADTLFPFTNASTPSDSNTGVPIEQGRKAILFRMQCFDAGFNQTNNCFPITSGAPSISINGGAPITCTAGLSPAAGACGFAVVAAFGPDVDTFKVVYNDDFPTNSPITATVFNATGNGGSTEPACPGAPDPACTLHFSTGALTPRANTSTELIFDISGSMALAATATDPTSRIQRLKEAANAFLQAYQLHTMLGDELGAVVFSTTASSLTTGTPNFVSGSDPDAVNTKVQGPINAQTPTNSTAIGEGLTMAKSLGFDAGPAANTKWAILFTDGEQNVPPPTGNVAATSGATSQVTVGGTTYSIGTNKLANPGQVTICPVTAGLQTSNGFILQQSIADALCNSHNGYVGMPQDFATYFQQLFTTVLKGDKLEISRDIAGSVTTTPSVTFVGNKQDISFTITVTHAPDAEGASYRLVAPDGTTVPLILHRFGGGSVAKVQLPVVIGKKQIATRGSWKVVFDPKTFGTTPDYHLIVANDNPTISTTFTTLGNDLGTGDPLQVQAAVLDKGKPLTNAKVTVDIAGPNIGLGNFLSKTAARGDPPNIFGDSASAAQRKLMTLEADKNNSKYLGIGSRPTQSLHYCAPGKGRIIDDLHKVLNISSKDCDRTKPPHEPGGPAPGATTTGGVYTTTFTQSTMEGHYFFTFHAKGTSADNGPFERTWKVSLFVTPHADAAHTPILVESLDRDSTGAIIARLKVTPHDQLNNFVGPGYQTSMAFLNGNKPTGQVNDNLDGSYEVQRVITAAGDSKVTLEILGRTVKTIDLGTARVRQTL
jgi:von Willebrand factor type A domain